MLVDLLTGHLGDLFPTVRESPELNKLEEVVSTITHVVSDHSRAIEVLLEHAQEAPPPRQEREEPPDVPSTPPPSPETLTLVLGVAALKQWTAHTAATVVYHSGVDPFTPAAFFEGIRGRPNVALITTTTDGDVFGAFYSVPISENETDVHDPSAFVFSLESHGRCETPQRFPIRPQYRDAMSMTVFLHNANRWFFTMGAGIGAQCGWFCIGNERSLTWSESMSIAFEGLEDTTLTGKNLPQATIESEQWDEVLRSVHRCVSLVAVQFD